MVEKVFLTEARREVLQGSTDLTGQSLQNQKSRIRVRSRLALEELTEVAESPEIDNTGVFDPDEVFRFLRALMIPDEPVAVDEEPSEAFLEYRERLEGQLAKLALEHATDDV